MAADEQARLSKMKPVETTPRVSRRVFVRRAAQVGAAATAVAWTAPGMTSIALAGANADAVPGSAPPRTNPSTTEPGGGSSSSTPSTSGSGGTTTTQSSTPDQSGAGSTTTGGGGVSDTTVTLPGGGLVGGAGGGTTVPDPGSGTGSGGSLPFTGGDAKDTALFGLAAIIVGRVLYGMRRVGGAPPHHHQDDTDPDEYLGPPSI